jgi:anti-anti-sigma regulatory factor
MRPTDSDRDVPFPLIDSARSAAPDDLSVRIDGATVFVTGVLAASTSLLLSAAVEYLQTTGLVDLQVDLSQVSRIESEGIRVLFDRQRALADVGGELRILAPPTLVPRLVLCRVELTTRGGDTGGRQRSHPTTG